MIVGSRTSAKNISWTTALKNTICLNISIDKTSTTVNSTYLLSHVTGAQPTMAAGFLPTSL